MMPSCSSFFGSRSSRQLLAVFTLVSLLTIVSAAKAEVSGISVFGQPPQATSNLDSRNYKSGGIAIRFIVPNSFQVGVPSVVKVAVTYRQNARINSLSYMDRPTMNSGGGSMPTPWRPSEKKVAKQKFRKAFGRTPVRGKFSLAPETFIGPIFAPTGFSFPRYGRERIYKEKFEVKPGRTEIIEVPVAFNTCTPWPALPDQLSRDLLKGMIISGERMDPPRPEMPWPGYQCLPVRLEVGASAYALSPRASRPPGNRWGSYEKAYRVSEISMDNKVREISLTP